MISNIELWKTYFELSNRQKMEWNAIQNFSLNRSFSFPYIVIRNVFIWAHFIDDKIF